MLIKWNENNICRCFIHVTHFILMTILWDSCSWNYWFSTKSACFTAFPSLPWSQVGDATGFRPMEYEQKVGAPFQPGHIIFHSPFCFPFLIHKTASKCLQVMPHERSPHGQREPPGKAIHLYPPTEQEINFYSLKPLNLWTVSSIACPTLTNMD